MSDDRGLPGDEEATRGYLDQISCTNRKVSALVDTILTRSRRPSVILLQSDHGHGRIGRIPALKYVKPDQVKERMASFAAYLLPGLEAERITDSITPVNVMRLVLAHYFGADLPLLEDASYWSTEARPLELVLQVQGRHRRWLTDQELSPGLAEVQQDPSEDQDDC